VSQEVREKKRWRLARVGVWTGILGGSLFFWMAAGAAVLAVMR